MTTQSAEAMEKARSVDKDFHFEGRSVLPHEIIVSIATALDAFAAEARADQKERDAKIADSWRANSNVAGRISKAIREQP